MLGLTVGLLLTLRDIWLGARMRSLVDRHNRLRGDIHNPIDTYLPDQQARFGFLSQ